MARILIVSSDVVGERMAGPGIRCWEFARALSAFHDVTLAIPNRPDHLSPGFSLVQIKESVLEKLAAEADILVCQGPVTIQHPFLLETEKYLVLDIYDVFLFEALELKAEFSPETRKNLNDHVVKIMNQQLLAGDFFLCSNVLQRDFWLGALAALGRLSPASYQDDKMLLNLIDEVPFGIPSRLPRHDRQVLRGVWPQFRADDFILIWGGGIWDWLDPFSVIQAMALVSRRRTDVKLFFMGGKRPNGDELQRKRVEEVISEAQRLKILDSSVFLNSGWVPYESRDNYLLESNVGIVCHYDLLETRFSFRTRILDHLWAGLPTISTVGDSISNLVGAERAGMTVPPEDPKALAESILELASRPELCRELGERARALGGKFRWPMVLRPLLAYCEAPRFAPDKGRMRREILSVDEVRRARVDFQRYLALTRKKYAEKGMWGTLAAVGRTIRRFSRTGELP